VFFIAGKKSDVDSFCNEKPLEKRGGFIVKTVLKILAAVGSALLLLKGLQVLIDVIYEEGNRRYITVDEEE